MTAASVTSSSTPFESPVRLAAIDIGTVTSRLLVADTDGVTVTPVARAYEITNLGAGVDATGYLSDAALKRVSVAVAGFLRMCDAASTADHPLEHITVMATSAARDARNADAFEAMLASYGLHPEVISGTREAELTFWGVTADVASSTPVAVVDVGGGSTEVSFGTAGDGLFAAHSFDVGCRRMTERFFHHDPPLPHELQDAYAWAHELFAAWRDEMPVLDNAGQGEARQIAASGGMPQLFAVAGTATSAISMDERMEVYDSEHVHGAIMGRERLEELLAELASMTEAQRENVAGLDPRRAPVIVAGLLILVCVMHAFRFVAFTASESDILQGMILCAARSPVHSRQIR